MSNEPTCYRAYDNRRLRGLPNWWPPQRWEFITSIDTEPVKSEPKTYSELMRNLLNSGWEGELKIKELE